MIFLGIWSMIECGLGIIAGSLATLRPLARKLSKMFRSLMSGGSNEEAVSSAPKKTPTPMKQQRRIDRKNLPIDQRGLSMLSDTNTGISLASTKDSKYTRSKNLTETSESGSQSFASPLATQKSTMSTTNAATETQQSKRPRRWRQNWWKPPTFNAGLMTEFDRGLDANRGAQKSNRREQEEMA